MLFRSPPRTETEDLQQGEQVWPEVAHRATLSYLEPEDDPKMSHGLYPVLPPLWRRGHAPYGPGVRVTEAQDLSRKAELTSPRELTGSSGRGSRRGAPTLCALVAVPAKISSAGSSTPRPQQGRFGAEASTRQQGTPQALTAMGRPRHRR